MRSGVYIEWQGLEFPGESVRDYRWVFVPFSAGEPEGEGWAADRVRGVWSRLVPPSEITRMHIVLTSASLDGVKVRVTGVNQDDRTADVRAENPPYSSINDQHRPPPHPLLSADPVSPYSIDWIGTVPWEALTQVDEIVAPLDPATGQGVGHGQVT